MYLELVRSSDNGVQTVGVLSLYDCFGNVLQSFDTLELGYKDNKTSISCIPNGLYVVSPNYSFRHGECLKIENVCNRSNILIHKGNFNKDTKGCILVGKGYSDLNNDFQVDVINSKMALTSLLLLVKYTIALRVISKF